MHVAVLTSPNSWYFRDLQRAAQDNVRVTAVPFSQLRADIDGDDLRFLSNTFDFADCDVVLVRTMPPGTLEQVVFRMDVLAQLEATHKLVLNPPKSLEIAVDKYLALAKLQRAGVPVPRTITCQTWEAAMDAFEQLNRDIVVKPLFGSEGRGLTRVTDESMAWRTFKLLDQLGSVIYLQEFIEHGGFDIRVLFIGDELFAIRRINPNDWRTNVAQGATTEPFALPSDLLELARQAADVVGAPLAGVDLISDQHGKYYVLEINAVPGWRAVARTLGVDVASRVLNFCKESVQQQGS